MCQRPMSAVRVTAVPRCPVCKTQADAIKYEGVTIYNCGSCGGHWLTQERLDVILARREVVMPAPVKKMIELADASNTARQLWCVTCGKPMIKEQFKHWPDIQLDRCPKCGGIWFDRGELEKCQIYWEYLQDHPDEWESMDTAARKALLEAELAQRRIDRENERERIRDLKRAYYPGVAGRILRDLLSRALRRS